MPNVYELVQWYNLVFVIPLALAAIILALQISGLLEFGESDGDADNDGIPDHLDHDFHAHTSQGGEKHGGIFGVLGLGKIPLSIVLISLLILFGFTGFTANVVLANFGLPTITFWLSLSIALVTSVCITSVLANAIAKIMPKKESYAESPKHFAGKSGFALYQITENSGFVRVKDQYGNTHELPARVFPGESIIPAGSEIALVEHDENLKGFYVVTTAKPNSQFQK